MNPAGWHIYNRGAEEAVAGAHGGIDENVRKPRGTVQDRFPRLEHVTLSGNYDRSSLRVPPVVYRKVGEMCPMGIKGSVAYFRFVIHAPTVE